MADLIKYTCASAIPLHKRFQRQAIATRLARGAGKKAVIEGYIAATTVSGDSSVTSVIDLPAQIVWMNSDSFDGFVTSYFGMVAVVGDRDLYLPRSVSTPTPAAVSATTARLSTPNVYQFVAPDYGFATAGEGFFTGPPTVWGNWVYGLAQSRAYTPAGNRDYVMTVYGLSWAASVRPYDPNTALVLPAPGVDPVDLLPSNKTRVVSIPAISVAIAAGKPDVEIEQVPNNVFLGSVQVRELPVPDAPNAVSMYVAVGGRDDNTVASNQRAVVVVGKVTLTDTVEQSIAWGAAPSIGGAAPGTTNVVEAIGLYVGAEVTVCTVAANANTDFYQTMIHRLDVDTGAVLGSATFTLYPELAHPICASRDALWVAKATIAADVSTSCALYRVVDGVAVLMNTGGWMPLCLLIAGTTRSDNVWYHGAMAPTVFELGEDRVGVIACAAGAYTAATVIDWYLIEIDVSSQSLVGVRGLVGRLSVAQFDNTYARPLAVTVVTPQVLDSDGVVVTPAVLLKNEFRTTAVSSDGGYTWRDVSTGTRGYPYYFGNRAHGFEFGKTL